jgi:hypothetical protein
MRDERFGRLLKAAVGSIVAHEGATAPVVEAQLGEQLRVAPASIQRYKAGHIPPEPRGVALLAAAGVTRGCLNERWLRAFLGAARYPHPEALVRELIPGAAAREHISLPRPPRHNLPAPSYPQFVPRAAMGEVLQALRQRTALVLITGLGGVGKTSLAREVAACCLQGVDELAPFAAVVWVSDRDAPGTTTLDTLLVVIARTLDEPGLLALAGEERLPAVERLLRRERVLLVVDQCETLTDLALLTWLPRLPEPSKALLTTRVERPELAQSSLVVPLGGFNAAEGGAFLAQHLRVHRLAERVADPQQLDGLLAATGGNAQALALALGELRRGVRSLPQLIADLGSARGAIVDAVLGWSWETLDEPAQRLLLAATLFRGPCVPDALTATAALQRGEGEAALARLTAGALLEVRRPDLAAAPRLGLHPLVRAFAASRLAALSREHTAMRRRQLAWYAELAAGVGYCWDDPGRLAVLDPEAETVVALLHWAQSDAEAIPDLARLVHGVDYYCYIRGLWSLTPELSAVRELAAERAGERVEVVRTRAYRLQMACRTGQLGAASAQLHALEPLKDDQALPADVRFEVAYTLALAATLNQAYEAAAQLWERALPLTHDLPVRASAVARGWLAICRYRCGDAAAAEALWSAVLHDAAESFPRGGVSSRIGLARLALDRGELAAAAQLLDAARSGAEAHGDRALLAESQALTARRLRLGGEPAAAERAAAEAREQYRRLGTIATIALDA